MHAARIPCLSGPTTRNVPMCWRGFVFDPIALSSDVDEKPSLSVVDRNDNRLLADTNDPRDSVEDVKEHRNAIALDDA